MHIDPTDENVQALLRREIDGPVVMLNLLRLREVADYSGVPDLAPAAPISGREAYERYVATARPYVEAGGGSVTFVGDGGACFVGPVEERWDLVMLVRQNSVADFFAFAEHADYVAALGHRTAALEDSRLVPLVESTLP
jgi:hypothetical protein